LNKIVESHELVISNQSRNEKKKNGNYFNSFLTSADVHVQSILIMLKEHGFLKVKHQGKNPSSFSMHVNVNSFLKPVVGLNANLTLFWIV